MKLIKLLTASAITAALAACAGMPGIPHRQPVVEPPAAEPAQAPVPAVTPEEAKAKLLQQKREAQQQKQELDDESRRLASYQKNLFQVFRLSESAAGFQARQDALGVFESKSARSGKMRVSLAQLPDSPAHLNVGSYTVNLDMLVEYVETRECIVGGCVGKTQNIVRSVPKTVQIPVSAKSGFAGTRELSFLDDQNAEPNAKNYRVSYSNLKMTVRRMTAAAQQVRGD
ncbi:MAG TPA: hypothetical protein VFS02_17295 [Telluria sp.]|nr:hypothetical protein [Telluria sp.]